MVFSSSNTFRHCITEGGRFSITEGIWFSLAVTLSATVLPKVDGFLLPKWMVFSSSNTFRHCIIEGGWFSLAVTLSATALLDS
jgi:hypothetical protein